MSRKINGASNITVEKCLVWAVRCTKCGWTAANDDRSGVAVLAGRHRVEGCEAK